VCVTDEYRHLCSYAINRQVDRSSGSCQSTRSHANHIAGLWNRYEIFQFAGIPLPVKSLTLIKQTRLGPARSLRYHEFDFQRVASAKAKVIAEVPHLKALVHRDPSQISIGKRIRISILDSNNLRFGAGDDPFPYLLSAFNGHPQTFVRGYVSPLP